MEYFEIVSDAFIVNVRMCTKSAFEIPFEHLHDYGYHAIHLLDSHCQFLRTVCDFSLYETSNYRFVCFLLAFSVCTNNISSSR